MIFDFFLCFLCEMKAEPRKWAHARHPRRHFEFNIPTIALYFVGAIKRKVNPIHAAVGMPKHHDSNITEAHHGKHLRTRWCKKHRRKIVLDPMACAGLHKGKGRLQKPALQLAQSGLATIFVCPKDSRYTRRMRHNNLRPKASQIKHGVLRSHV